MVRVMGMIHPVKRTESKNIKLESQSAIELIVRRGIKNKTPGIVLHSKRASLGHAVAVVTLLPGATPRLGLVFHSATTRALASVPSVCAILRRA